MSEQNGDMPVQAGGDDPEDVEVSFVSGRTAARVQAMQSESAGLAHSPEMKGTPAAGAGDAISPHAATMALEDRLASAREYLRKNELDEALSLAMDIAREHPELAEAKMLIARCFINRKEYLKAQAILQAIPDAGKNAGTYYYLGLCRGRMGDSAGAIEDLEKGLAANPDEAERTRTEELLVHLRDGDATCPECSRKTPYSTMEDVGDKTVCAACAQALTSASSRKHLQAKAGAVVTGSGGLFSSLSTRLALLTLLIAALAYAGLYALSATMPDIYANVRSRLPARWTFLPGGPVTVPEVVKAPEPAAKAGAPAIDSRFLRYAIAGVPLERQVMINGGVIGEDFTAQFSPDPRGRHRMDTRTGRFSWVPTDSDAGERYTLTFGATLDGAKAREQVNHLRVYSPPRFRQIHLLSDVEPDSAGYLAAADFSGDGVAELLAVQGNYKSGRMTLLRETADGLFHPMCFIPLSGRPAGAGVVGANDINVICVADYRNSVLRYYTLRDNRIQEHPIATPLPGKPVLAGFERDSGIIAALCRTETAMRLVCHRAVEASHIEKVGDWTVPGDFVWKKVLALPERKTAPARPRVLLAGGDPEKSLLLFSPEWEEPRRIAFPVSGTLLDATNSPDGRIQCLVEDSGEYTLVEFTLDDAGRPNILSSLTIGNKPFLNGMAPLNLFGAEAGGNDVAYFSATHLGLALDGMGDVKAFAQWQLPSPSRLLGTTLVLPGKDDSPDRVVFWDAEGALWSAGLAEEEIR